MTSAELDKHDIVRNTLCPQNIGILLGNGKMGGLARTDGFGMSEIWLSDYWKTPGKRASLPGFTIAFGHNELRTPAKFAQRLSLYSGALQTETTTAEGTTLSCEIFVCNSAPNLIAFRCANRSQHPVKLQLALDMEPKSLSIISKHAWSMQFETSKNVFPVALSRACWTVRSSIPFDSADGHEMSFTMPAGGEMTFTFAIYTNFESDDFEVQSKAAALSAPAYHDLKSAHCDGWRSLWERFSLHLPDQLMETALFRSLYYSFAITGNSSHLQGECHFAESAWEMVPFTIGTPSWVGMLLSTVNHPERAMEILAAFHKKDILKENAANYLYLLKKSPIDAINSKFSDPYSFAHKPDFTGRELTFAFGRQRYLDGFAPAFFDFIETRATHSLKKDSLTFDVLKGCAKFWLNLVEWDEKQQAYTIPPTLGYDECLVKESTLAAALACEWTLERFVNLCEEFGVEKELATEAKSIASKVLIANNGSRYLDYPGDDESRDSGSYHCLRNFVFLGFPFCELSRRDQAMALRTLDSAYQRNRFHEPGRGFNTMTTNHYALAEAFFGRGDKARDYLKISIEQGMDPTGIAMGEASGGHHYYFATGYTSYALACISMCLQSYGNVIYPFPALPEDWKELSFENLTAQGGVLVSGEMKKNGALSLRFSSEGNKDLEMNKSCPIHIGDHGKLTPQST